MLNSSLIARCLTAALALSALDFARAQQPPAAGDSAAKPQAAEKPKIYDEAADAKSQINEALARAKKENRRVLIQWGGNWCGWCIKLHGLYKSDNDIKRKLLYEYDVVFVDAGRPAGKNVDLASSYGADLKKHGFPYLTILDADGKAIANQETGSFENKDQKANPGHDPKKVLEFMTANQASPLDAHAVLDEGLSQAKSENKRVFLHFGAPWCGWCRKLEAWMARDDVRAILAKDFVDVKIDQDRMTGGKDLKPKFGTSDKAGIPWFAFLDADGKVLIDSTGPKGNTGFPQAPEEVEHFKAMLTKAAARITADEITMLCDSLTKKEAKTALAQ